ncbi:MAG: MBL fold metallo-hydrolase [Halolamina sp.]
MTIHHQSLAVEWLGYATVRVETPSGYVAYLDPGRYGVLDGHYPKDADLVCVTHDHHYDSDGVDHVAGDDATVVVYDGVDAGRIDRDATPPEELAHEVVRVGENDRLDIDDVTLWTVAAYNDPDGPHVDADGDPHHPEGFGVGYLLSLAGTTVFWPGDGDALDAYAELDVSLYLANVGGTVVSNAAESAALAESMAPDLVLPVHYDTFEMLTADAQGFAADVAERGIPVVLDERDLKQ